MDRLSIPLRRLAMTWGLVFVLLTLASGPAAGQSVEVVADNYIRAAKLGKADFGMLITDLETGEPILDRHADKALIPASNMKLVTTAAALDVLGSDFHFSTQLRMDGDTLIIRGDGDPGFGDPELLKAMDMTLVDFVGRWVDAVQRTGKKRFDTIIVDDRVFDQQFTHPDWPRNQLHKWYCAQVAAINFNDNCLDLYATPRAAGRTPQIVIEPPHAPILLDNDATSGKRNAFWASRKLGGNRIILRGQVKHALVQPAHVTIHDPPMFFGELLQRHLREAGIEVDEVRRPDPQQVIQQGQLLAEVQTTLPTVVARCNRDSQNLFAETLLKRIGHEITTQPGSWSNGAAAIRGFLTRRLGSDAASVIIADGSGMSRENRVTAKNLVDLLATMHNDEDLAAIYRLSLAAPGEAGTLEGRFENVELAGRVRAKSGYLKGVISLSGYLTVGDKPLAFSMIVNDYYGSTYHIKQLMEKILAAVDADIASRQPVKLGG